MACWSNYEAYDLAARAFEQYREQAVAFPSAWALVLLIRGEAGWGKRIQGNNYHNASTKVLSFLADLILTSQAVITNQRAQVPSIDTNSV